MGDLVELANYAVADIEVSLGKVGRGSDGVVLRPALFKYVGKGGGESGEKVVKIFWKGRTPRRMGPTRVLDFPSDL